MEKGILWKITLFGVSIAGIVLCFILYYYYASGKLGETTHTLCYLQSCVIINETCNQTCPEHQPQCIPANFTCQFHLANYSYVVHNRTYSATRQLFIDQVCLVEVECHFIKPNSTVLFEGRDGPAEVAIGLTIIFSMLIFCACAVIIPFFHFWQKQKEKQNEIPTEVSRLTSTYEPI
jgi:hypothetical protein